MEKPFSKCLSLRGCREAGRHGNPIEEKEIVSQAKPDRNDSKKDAL